MASIFFAFSVHHFVSSVGADAGFAAIIGLAILAFLYFAQARETASLRRQAEEHADHVEQLELRVAQLSRSGVGSGTMPPAPAPAPPGINKRAAAPAPAPARRARRLHRGVREGVPGAAPALAAAARASAVASSSSCHCWGSWPWSWCC